MRQLKTLCTAGACVIASYVAPTFAASSNADAAEPGSWGVNVQTPYRGPALIKLNVQWVRVAIGWKKIESTSAGHYDWTDADKLLNYYLDNGFHVLCNLNLEQISPAYAGQSANQRVVLKAIANWMGATALRYKGKGIVWELGNEPETFPMGNYWNHADTYAQMAKAAASAIKHSDSSAKVAALSIAWMDRGFATKALAAGLLDGGNIDYLSFHGYHRKTLEPESGLVDDVTWLREQAAANSGGKTPPDVIDSEDGYAILPFESPKVNTSWRTSVYTEDAQAAYLARHYLEEMYLRIPISIWYKDMFGDHGFSLYYADEKDPRGLRPSGRIYGALAELLPDNPAAMQNTQFSVAVKAKTSASDAAKALAFARAAVSQDPQLIVRSFLRLNAAGQRVLVIGAWNAIEAFDGKILASRTFNGTQVSEKWRDVTPNDPVSIPSRITIGSMNSVSIKSTRVITFQHGDATARNGTLEPTTEGKTIDLTLTSTPTMVDITFTGGPVAPSDLRVAQ